MRTHFAFAFSAVLACVLAATAAPALGFEGVVKFRNVTADISALAAAGQVSPQPGAEDLFAIPTERLMAMKPGVRTETLAIYIKGAKVRVNEPGGKGYMVMNTDTGEGFMVMPSEKAYVAMGKEERQQMGRRMKAMQEQMQKALSEQLASMPPEQRRRLEAAMQQHGAMGGMMPGKREPVKVRPLGKTATVNGVRATAYEVRRGTKVTRGWVTDAYPELLRTFRSVEEKQAEMLPEGAQDGEAALAKRGFPVRIQTFSGDYAVEDLVAVEKKSVGDEQFSIPPGFRKRSMRELAGGARPR